MAIHTDLLQDIARTKKTIGFSKKSRFQILPHDRVTISGTRMKWCGQVANGYLLCPDIKGGVSEYFSYEHLSRLNSAGEILHERDQDLCETERQQNQVENSSLFDLTEKQRDRFWARFGMVSAFLELERAGRVKPNDTSIKKMMPEICTLAATLANEEMPSPEETMRDEEIRLGHRRRRQGGQKTILAVSPVHATTLRKWVKAYRRLGKDGLIDCIHNRGNRFSYFSSEERELLAEETRKSYLDLNRPTKKKTTEDVQRAFKKVNELRVEKGLTPYRVPSRDAVRRCINSFSNYEIVLNRYGFHEAMKRCKPVGRGVETFRPLERCEMDEWNVDLLSVISGTGLRYLFSQEELESLGLLDKEGARSRRWWISVIIDCRTKCILAMKLAKNPAAATAIDCLKMALQDKGAWVDAVGAEAAWDMFGLPETLVTDNGPAFKSQLFSSTCLDLGITHVRTIAGLPYMRGAIERVLKTASTGVVSRLHGRTFSSSIERGDHPTEERACLNTEDLCFALVRWIVDVYHNTPHEGLHGRTPLQQWDEDMESGNFPAQAAPDMKRKRLVFGAKLKRKLSKSGLTVMGVPYHSEQLAEWYARRGKQELNVSWLPENIGAIFVQLGQHWVEVPSVYEEFENVHAQQWVAARRRMKISDPQRRRWTEQCIANALEAIDEMNFCRSLEFGLVSQAYSEARVTDLESELFIGFEVAASKPQLESAPEQFGMPVVPVKPEWLAGTQGNIHVQPEAQADVWESDEEEGK